MYDPVCAFWDFDLTYVLMKKFESLDNLDDSDSSMAVSVVSSNNLMNAAKV